jgi:endonuclease/exonuclease/phosphatase (EEP) superfamily protein YafD
MQIFTLILVGICLISTLLSLIPTHQGWVRIFDFPKPHITILSIISLILLVLFFQNSPWTLYTLLILLIAVISFHSIKMIKYTTFYPHKAPESTIPDPSNTFSILLCNVNQENHHHEKFKKLITRLDPDILLLAEVNSRWSKELEGLDEIYSHQIKYPQENGFGMSFYSRLPLEKSALKFLVEDTIPSVYAKISLPSGNAFTFHGLHPAAPRPNNTTYERDTELLITGENVLKENEPAVVGGHFNDVAWSRTSELFQSRTQMWDPREGRGFFNTYNVFTPPFRFPLDHFFYTKDFLLVSLNRLESVGSDHFPLMITLEYKSELNGNDAK